MSIKAFLFSGLFLLLTYISVAQTEESPYKRIYEIADSLNSESSPFLIDSNTLIRITAVNKKHPWSYFEIVGELMQSSKYDDASFVYYLGLLRYMYYNSANRRFKESEDGALFASAKYVIGEIINLYLKTNVDRFIFILKAASEYHLKQDYKFYPRKKSPIKFEEIGKSFLPLIEDLKTNKQKYEIEWKNERKRIMNIE